MQRRYSSPEKGLFPLLPALVLAGAFGMFCGCDALNAPLKEEIAYHLSLHPVKTGEELTAAIGAVPPGGSGAFTIMTDIFLSATILIDGKTITVEAYAGNSDEKVIRRAAGFSGLMFRVQSGGKLVLGGGRNKENLALDGEKRAGSDSLVTVPGSGALVLNDGAELRNNREPAPQQGGAVLVSGGSFTMNGGLITGNAVTGSLSGSGGGGVYISGSGSSFVMNGGSITGNTVSGNDTMGAGVFVKGGSFAMNGGTISENETEKDGGGVYVTGGFTMNGGSVSGNTAGNDGGGVCVTGAGRFTMNGGSISGNISTFGGGGVGSTHGGEFTMKNGSLRGNTASHGGGVIVFNNASFRMEGGSISENTAIHGLVPAIPLAGGGVLVRSASGGFTMTGGSISGNIASEGYGGGVCVSDGPFYMSEGTISGNVARLSDGGGVYVHSGSTSFTMSGGTIGVNTAGGNGGGVYIFSTPIPPYTSFTLSGGRISRNTAGDRGGGVCNEQGEFTMSGGTISGNTAAVQGGGVHNWNGLFKMGGSATVNVDNPVFPQGAAAAITLTGPLSANPAANIAGTFGSGTQLLTNNAFLMGGSPANYTRFLVNGAPGKINHLGVYTP
jgi:hypothetical protein